MLCGLCQCDEAYDFHHFIPRSLHRNRWFKRRFTRDQMRAGIDVCKQCHGAIHGLVPDEKRLGRECPTLEKLRSHPEIAKYVEWKRRRARSAPPQGP
jgi:hypothetical protein